MLELWPTASPHTCEEVMWELLILQFFSFYFIFFYIIIIIIIINNNKDLYFTEQ